MKLNKKTITVAILSGLVLGGLFLMPKLSNPDKNSNKDISKEAQTSLIEVVAGEVKSNSKPKEVINSFDGRFDKLSKDNKTKATELIYTSIQNSTLYYNTASYVMTGEVSYSKDKKDAISAKKSNKWVSGFIEEAKDQKIVANNLNEDFILFLPDFEYLYKNYYDYADKDLSILLEAGYEAQKLNVFNSDAVNSYKSGQAYDLIRLATIEMEEQNPNSKYLQDINSLGRIYHDATFGFIQTNNLEKDGDDYKLLFDSKNDIANLSKGQLGIAKEASDFLKNVYDNNVVTGSYLKEEADKSIKKFGTSVYWQSTGDITSMMGAE